MRTTAPPPLLFEIVYRDARGTETVMCERSPGRAASVIADAGPRSIVGVRRYVLDPARLDGPVLDALRELPRPEVTGPAPGGPAGLDALRAAQTARDDALGGWQRRIRARLSKVLVQTSGRS